MLRRLELQDAKFMLKWMRDQDICSELIRDFENMTMEDCVSFIKQSWENDKNRHFAVCGAENQYQGTISLKNIDWVNKHAKYAIVILNLMAADWLWFQQENY